MTEPVLRLVVLGTPGTAGSKSAFPVWRTGPDGRREFVKTVVVEKDLKKVKANWRTQIMNAASAQTICVCPDPDCTKMRDPFPLDEALAAALVFTVKKPTSAPKTVRSWPIARPDTLKYARAFEDALTAAGVLKDDARLVDYRRLAKVYPREDPDALDAPGAVFTLWRMATLLDWQHLAVNTTSGTGPTLFTLESPPGVVDIQGRGARAGGG